MGWTIRVVNRGVNVVEVTSDPGVFDTDGDGLNDSREYYITYTNASNKDTDGDNLEDYTEAVDGFVWDGVPYTTNASMFDTDNDGLEDGEEIALGLDQYITHANNSDTDNDTLNDGDEVLFVPRPWQAATNPLVNDTDGDGICDGPIAFEGLCHAGPDPYPLDPNAPIDTDDDGLPDENDGWTGPPMEDDDDDNDGTLDVEDDFPLDDGADTDTDGDGDPDNLLYHPYDGPLVVDEDDDNDGWNDTAEIECGTEPLNASSVPVDDNENGICDALEENKGSCAKDCNK